MAQHAPDAIARWVDTVSGKNITLQLDRGQPQGCASSGDWWRFVVELAHATSDENAMAALGPASPTPLLLTNSESVWVSVNDLDNAKTAADTSMAALDTWWAGVSTEAGNWFAALTSGQRSSIKTTLSACRP